MIRERHLNHRRRARTTVAALTVALMLGGAAAAFGAVMAASGIRVPQSATHTTLPITR